MIFLFLCCFLPLSSFGASPINFSSETISMVVSLTFLSLAPILLLMMTSFTRLVIALSFVRQGMGVQNMPPGSALSAIALFLTFFIMHKPIESAYQAGIKPYLEQKITLDKAFEKAAEPMREFMLKNVKEKDLEVFSNIAKVELEDKESIPNRVLIPSFMLSEIKRGFEMGFLILSPFTIIDIVVSIVLVSLGMMMVPPISIALPLKVILFSIVDGWGMLFGSLVKSFS